MDQQLSTMDPKLKEAYDRIMGNTPKPVAQTADLSQTNPIPPVQQNQSQNSQPAQLNNQQPTNSQPNSANVNPLPSSPATQPAPQAPTPQPFMDPVLADNQMHAYVAQEVAGVKQSLKVIQIMYIVGGLVFFAVYALFWMKFFNIPSPF